MCMLAWRNAGDTHLCTILCHNLSHGELWLVRVSPHNPLTHSNQLQLVMWRVVTQSCAKLCVTSISPCKHAYPDSLVCSVVNKLFFKQNRSASGKRTTVSYFIILFRFVKNWHVNNYKNIMRLFVLVSQYKCQLTSIFRRGKKKP